MKKIVLASITSVFTSVAFAQVTIEDYWAGKAQWSLVSKWTPQNAPLISEGGTGGANWIRVVNGVWYLFSRKAISGSVCNNTTSTDAKLGLQVFKSTDHGVTWSAPTMIITPTEGSPSSCAATDGDAFYDATQNKWRLIYQCMGDDRVWNGCYAERAGADPMGSFTPVSQNPVIRSKSLWSQICNSSADNCVTLTGGTNRVGEEGTFNIIQFDGVYFWVSFHGAYDTGIAIPGDTHRTLGFRGIAKTKDFISWIAGDAAPDLPNDAIFSSKDTSNWRESWNGGSSIGAGGSSTILENGKFYTVAEFADKTLNCTPGQNWDIGLFRSATLTNRNWDQFPYGNPIIQSSKVIESGIIPPCNIQYAHIFKDTSVSPNVTYLKFFRRSENSNVQGTYLYKLEYSTNLVSNGNLWKGTSENWLRLPSGIANMVTYRDPNRSSDGNNYLAFNCGTYPNPCLKDQSIYQDVNVESHRGKTYNFGGKFSADSGGEGSLRLIIFQLDQNYTILRSDYLDVNVSSDTYRSLNSQSFPILNTAKFLRYQFAIYNSSVTYFADEMYINVQ
ncbi:MAG: hypothetical protein HY253_11440 [Burkholderiales bacterium]|nr:hypothetical protein [Burkholderiales bacterium]